MIHHGFLSSRIPSPITALNRFYWFLIEFDIALVRLRFRLWPLNGATVGWGNLDLDLHPRDVGSGVPVELGLFAGRPGMLVGSSCVL